METVSLAIASVYLYWSGGVGKFEFVFIRWFTRSLFIITFLRQGCVNVLRQNNNMSRSRFASFFDSCAATKEEGNKLQFME